MVNSNRVKKGKINVFIIFLIFVFFLFYIMHVKSQVEQSTLLSRGYNYDVHRLPNGNNLLTMNSEPINYLDNNGIFQPVDSNIISVSSFQIEGISLGYGVEKGVYRAFFSGISSNLISRPVFVVYKNTNYTLSLSPGAKLKFDKPKPGKTGDVGSKQLALTSITQNRLTYKEQYKNIGNSKTFANLSYIYLSTRLKEEFIVYNRSYINERFSTDVDIENRETTNLVFSNNIIAFRLSNLNQNTLGVKFQDTIFKDYGLPSTSSMITSDEVIFTDENGDTVFFIPKLYAYDSSDVKLLLDKNISINGYSLNMDILVPFTWLNNTDRVYPVIIDPTVNSFLANNTASNVTYLDDARSSTGCVGETTIPPTTRQPARGNCTITESKPNLGAADDTVEGSLFGNKTKPAWMYVVMNTGINNSDVIRLNWTWRGKTCSQSACPSAIGNASFYIYNETSSAWVYTGFNVSSNGIFVYAYMNFSNNTLDVKNFVNGTGHTTFLVMQHGESGGTAGTVNTDYIELQIEWNPETTITLNSPLNDSLWTIANVTVNFTVNDTNNTRNIIIKTYLNETITNLTDKLEESLYNTTNRTPEASILFNFSNLIDNRYYWLIKADDGGLGNTTSPTRTFVVSARAPTVTLNFPTDNYATNNSNVTFNATATDNNALRNFTLHHNISGSFIANETNKSAVTSGTTYNWTPVNNIADGRYIWNALALDIGNNSGFASSNFTLTIDTIIPIVTAIEPTGTKTTRTNIPINWSINDTNINTCWYNRTFTSGEASGASLNKLTCVDNGSYFNVSADGDYVLYLFANDTAVNQNSTNITFTISTGQASGGGGGGGTTTKIINETKEIVKEVLAAYCGNNICESPSAEQPNFNETILSCSNDCKPLKELQKGNIGAFPLIIIIIVFGTIAILATAPVGKIRKRIKEERKSTKRLDKELRKKRRRR